MHFLPALLGVPLVEIDGEYRQLLTHSVKLGGLAIHNPSFGCIPTVISLTKGLGISTFSHPPFFSF
jgi:hypothetical protein